MHLIINDGPIKIDDTITWKIEPCGELGANFMATPIAASIYKHPQHPEVATIKVIETHPPFVITRNDRRFPAIQMLYLAQQNFKNLIEEKEKPVVSDWKNERQHDVHTAHCCVYCGCKYGQSKTCSVVTGRKIQQYHHITGKNCRF